MIYFYIHVDCQVILTYYVGFIYIYHYFDCYAIYESLIFIPPCFKFGLIFNLFHYHFTTLLEIVAYSNQNQTSYFLVISMPKCRSLDVRCCNCFCDINDFVVSMIRGKAGNSRMSQDSIYPSGFIYMLSCVTLLLC